MLRQDEQDLQETNSKKEVIAELLSFLFIPVDPVWKLFHAKTSPGSSLDSRRLVIFGIFL